MFKVFLVFLFCLSQPALAGYQVVRRVPLHWAVAKEDSLLRLAGDSFAVVAEFPCDNRSLDPCPLGIFYFKNPSANPQLIVEFPAGEKILEMPHGQGYLIQSNVTEFTLLKSDGTLGAVYDLKPGQVPINIKKCIVTSASLLVCPHYPYPPKEYSSTVVVYDLKSGAAPVEIDIQNRFGDGSYLLETDDGFVSSHYKTDFLVFFKNDLSFHFERKMDRPQDYVIANISPIVGGVLVQYFDPENSRQAFVHVKETLANKVYRFDLGASSPCDYPLILQDFNRDHFYTHCGNEVFKVTSEGQILWRFQSKGGFQQYLGNNKLFWVSTWNYPKTEAEFTIVDSRDGSLMSQIYLGLEMSTYYLGNAIFVGDQIVTASTPSGYHTLPSPRPSPDPVHAYKSEVLILSE